MQTSFDDHVKRLVEDAFRASDVNKVITLLCATSFGTQLRVELKNRVGDVIKVHALLCTSYEMVGWSTERNRI